MIMENKNTSQKMELYCDRPASVWEETLPIGNGRKEVEVSLDSELKCTFEEQGTGIGFRREFRGDRRNRQHAGPGPGRGAEASAGAAETIFGRLCERTAHQREPGDFDLLGGRKVEGIPGAGYKRRSRWIILNWL